MLPISFYGDIKNQPLIFFHGLFGRGDDFLPLISYLEDRFFCVTIDLPGHGRAAYHIEPEELILKTLQALSLHNPVAIGYSMGGRILMQLQKETSIFHKTFFLSAHLGLEKDFALQREKEDLWIERLKMLDLYDFLCEWYKQPIFSSLQKNKKLLDALIEKRASSDKAGLIRMMDHFRLSEQKMFYPDKARHILFYGEEDEKYKELYTQKNWAADVVKISTSGHAVHIENPLQCAENIRKIIDEGR